MDLLQEIKAIIPEKLESEKDKLEDENNEEEEEAKKKKDYVYD